MMKILTGLQILLFAAAIVLIWIGFLPAFDGRGNPFDEDFRIILGGAAWLVTPAVLITGARWLLHRVRRA